MKTGILALTAVLLLIASNLFAADFIVDGKVGIGTTNPQGLLHLTAVNDSGSSVEAAEGYGGYTKIIIISISETSLPELTGCL